MTTQSNQSSIPGFAAISSAVIAAWPKGLLALNQALEITAVNSKAEQLLGWPEKEMVGKHIHSLLCSNAADYSHSEHNCPMIAICNKIPNNSCEAWWIKQDGEFINVNVEVLMNHLLDENQDGCEQAPFLLSFSACPLEGFSDAQTKRLAQFAESSPLPILEFAEDGSIDYANPAMVALLVETGFDDFGRPAVLPPNIEDLIKQCIESKTQIDNIEQESEAHVFLWTFYPITQSWPPRVQAYGQDISELRQTQKGLESALIKAQVATQTKSQFLANMSHEIRTPLTAIIGYAESIWEGNLKGEAKKDAMGTIIQNGKQMLQIINDILDASKIEAGKLSVEIIPVDLGEILHHIENISLLSARDKEIGFSIDVEYPIPKTFSSDPVRIKQILLNLCSNAIKFTHEGGVTVKVRYDEPSNLLHFDVVDSGIGITEEQGKHLFGSFSQADASTTRNYGGSGLGLFISRQLSEMLGGQLSFSSVYGEGTTFSSTITAGEQANIVFADAKGKLFSDIKERAVETINCQFNGKVLVAEDYAENRALVKMYLSTLGLSVDEAENGAIAMQLGLQKSYDLILMDIQMPEMDGLEAVQLLREAGYSAPIVALTANVMQDEVAHYLANGFDGWVGKPIDRHALFEVLDQYLQTSNGTAALTSFCESMSDDDEDANELEQLAELLDDDEDDSTEQTSDDDDGFADFYSSPAYKALVNSFLSTLEEEVSNMDEAIAKEDWKTLQSLVHKMKGAGGSFGFDDITNVATDIDLALKNSENRRAKQLYPDLKSVINTTLKANGL